MKEARKDRYVQSILEVYLRLPDTPKRIHRLDRKLAGEFYDQQLAVEIVEAAMLLAAMRRIRPDDMPPLGPIRSLHYFIPVIRELTAPGVSESYIAYIRRAAAERLK